VAVINEKKSRGEEVRVFHGWYHPVAISAQLDKELQGIDILETLA